MLERRRLGRTGHESTVAVLGGAAFWAATPDEAREGFDLALARGVNHLDIAPQYGAAESVVGPLVPAVRDRLFVGGKTLRANADGVRAQFDDTRRLLGCDVLDLYQAHAVTTVEELDRRAAALEAIVGLRDAGKTRFAGITGHDHGVPAAFLAALERFDLDTVMFPVTPLLWGDPAYRESAEELLTVCAARDLGVMAIKAAARRPWGDGRPLTDRVEGDPATAERWADTWYEPNRPGDRLADGIRFALSTPGVTAICTPGDRGLLPAVLDACEAASPMTDDERTAAIDRAVADGADIFPIPR
jgi:aryl-alcohol dehydrogenase-like predicted oxidoreductase